MNYDEYVNIVSYLDCSYRKNKCSSISALSVALNKPQSELLSLISQLSSLGCPVKLGSDGNLLSTYQDVYSIEKIKAVCGELAVSDVSIFLSIESTNTYLKSLKNKAELSVCIAETQTKGRGRRGKSWESPFGSNLYFSIKKKIKVRPQDSGSISLIVGLAIIRALEGLGFPGLKIKWPNDIYAENKKLAGVLIEVVSVKYDAIELVIGVGVNVKMPQASEQVIDQPWIDLSQLSAETRLGKKLSSRTEIVISLIRQINSNLQIFEREGLDAFTGDWKQNDFLYRKSIKVIQENKTLYGVVVGINELGELLLECDTGIISVNAGEVSVRLTSPSERLNP